MNWYYESGGQQNGPVTDSDLDRLLAEGKITPDTLIWREGLPGWAPMRTARPSVAAPAPGAPPPVPGAEAPPPGYIRCTLTGKYFPPGEIIYIEGKPYSAEAKPQVMQNLQAGAALPSGSFMRSGPPWEDRATLGVLKTAWETIKIVLTQPSQVFATMKRDGGLGSPLLFMVVVGGGGLALNYLYGALLQGVMLSFIGAAASSNSGAPNPFTQLGLTAGFTAGMSIVLIVMAPVIAVVMAFIWAGLAHLGLMIFKGANHPFEVTMRTVCYALGSGWALYAIPFCGGYVGGIWAIVVLCIGLPKTQDTTTGKGVAAALTPLMLCCLLAILLGGAFAVLGGIGAAAASRH